MWTEGGSEDTRSICRISLPQYLQDFPREPATIKNQSSLCGLEIKGLSYFQRPELKPKKLQDDCNNT